MVWFFTVGDGGSECRLSADVVVKREVGVFG
jgi:hypothetical protein